jgi:hypothetical protein
MDSPAAAPTSIEGGLFAFASENVAVILFLVLCMGYVLGHLYRRNESLKKELSRKDKEINEKDEAAEVAKITSLERLVEKQSKDMSDAVVAMNKTLVNLEKQMTAGHEALRNQMEISQNELHARVTVLSEDLHKLQGEHLQRVSSCFSFKTVEDDRVSGRRYYDSSRDKFSSIVTPKKLEE